MFNESNAVEALIRDLLSKRPQSGASPAWKHIPGRDLPRVESDVLVEPLFKEALIRLNPEIAEDPERAEEVLYRLRAIVLSVGTDGLVKSVAGNKKAGDGSEILGRNGQDESPRCGMAPTTKVRLAVVPLSIGCWSMREARRY